MACTTCSRSGTALPSSDKTRTLTGRATLVVPAGTYAASVSARLVDLAYQGKSIIDPNGWMPVPTADFLRDASNRLIGAKIMLSAGHLVVVTAP